MSLTYEPNPNSLYPEGETARDWLMDISILDDEVEFLNENFRLPYDVEIAAEECGEPNAFYDHVAKKISICYEYVDDVLDLWHIFNEDGDPDDASLFNSHVILDTFHHELGHAVIDIYEIPITGLEENVADQFAALMLSSTYGDADNPTVSQEILRNAMTYWQYEDEWRNVLCPEQAESPEEAAECKAFYGGEHSLDIQRFYNVACYAYGSDPEYNADLVVDGTLPEDRAANCEFEYWRAYSSWGQLLERFTNGLFDDDVG